MGPSVIALTLLEANVSSACPSWESLPWAGTSCGGLRVRGLELRSAFPPWAKLSVLANQRVVATGPRGELMWILFSNLCFCQSKLLPLFGWGIQAQSVVLPGLLTMACDSSDGSEPVGACSVSAKSLK